MSESATELLPVPSAIRTAAVGHASGRDLLGHAIGLVADDLARTEVRLRELCCSDVPEIPEVVGHLAFAGGKRLRPLLTLLCARAVDLDDPERITIAAVGELLHTATLLHDDVVDAGEFRRGRPAARLRFGNGMAVLTGDFCLARSLAAVAGTGRAQAVRSMADTVMRMAEGEVAQLGAAGRFEIDRARYYDVIDRKTAALIAWCSSVAGLVDARWVEPLARFGHELGLSFQIADDVLDMAPREGDGTAGVTGKDPGQDLRDGKMTLPLSLACEADPELQARVRAVLQAGPPMDDETADAIVAGVVRTGALAASRKIAADHARAAKDALALLPRSPASEALCAVADFVVGRTS
jgi:octaprenyl-diphosphate synthase